MDEVEIAWAAGFFDGEGCVSINGGRIFAQMKQNADLDMGIPDTLERFLRAVGRGRIGGPYIDRPSRKGFSPRRHPQFTWYALHEDAAAVLELLWPHLGKAKRAAAERCMRDARAA